MNEEKLAVSKLKEIMDAKKCPVTPAVLQGFINRIVKCDRLLAIVSIQDAARRVEPEESRAGLAMVAKGDQEAATGRYANAIEHYRNAGAGSSSPPGYPEFGRQHTPAIRGEQQQVLPDRSVPGHGELGHGGHLQS